MAEELNDLDGFDLLPVEAEPPEGDLALALQEDAVADEGIEPVADAPPVVGRTWRLDLAAGRLAPEGRLPDVISGDAAMRQAVEKALRTSRGSAAVQGDDYGREEADQDAEGQPFDASEFADLEERVRDCLLVLPWVLDVEDFTADEQLVAGTSAAAIVSFRVVPEGEAEPLLIDRFPLPTS